MVEQYDKSKGTPKHRPVGANLILEDLDMGNGTVQKVWRHPFLKGLQFNGSQEVRESDPRKLNQTVDQLPKALEPCHIHSALPADMFIPVCERDIWRPGESLWYGNMKAKHLEMDTQQFTNVYSEVIDFFNNPRTLTWDKSRDRYTNHMPKKWRPVWGQPHINTAPDYPPNVSTEIICKALWLITEYLDNNKTFDNPMCAHYNPIRQDNIIHPGGFRKKLLKMYNDADDDVRVFYFNTGGFYHTETMADLERKDFLDLKSDVFQGLSANGSLVAEHGTLIPHIYVGSDVIYNRQYEFLDIIAERITDPEFKICFNEPWAYQDYHNDLPFIIPHNHYGNAYCNVELGVYNHPWAKVDLKYHRDTVIIMSVFHALLNRTYSDSKLTVRFKDE